MSKSKVSAQEIQAGIRHYLTYHLGLARGNHSKHDLFLGLSHAVRQQLITNMLETLKRYRKKRVKRMYCLSIEFLMGRLLGNNIYNLLMLEQCALAMDHYNVQLDEIRESERDTALGNGGLGRLAACFLDSLATLDLPGFGYGINYEFGLFRQEIAGGYQVEKSDNWHFLNSPWLITRREKALFIPLYGKIVHYTDRQGNYHPMWMDWQLVLGVPSDIPIVGYGGTTVNWLRLFAAQATDDFNMAIFNHGDYVKAVQQKIQSETISKILYPNDSYATGKELRLVQEYFLVACATRDIINQFEEEYDDYRLLPEKVAIQLNDTHPALTVAELMRLLVDEKELEWQTAWDITRRCCAVTNHTLLPEALECWSVELVEKVLPRHLQIIFEVNRRFLERVQILYPGNRNRVRDMSIISDEPDKQVRMINLAAAGCHSINGVAKIHSDLIKKNLLPDFYDMFPEKFNNKTNGVTQRRWLLKANPLLSTKISSVIGDGWITDFSQIKNLLDYRDDRTLIADLRSIKRLNKQRLAQIIYEKCDITVSPDSIFDIHAKRFHEYKRQLLNILRVIHDYISIREYNITPEVERTYIFAGKAAPGYRLAKLHIKLIHELARIINNDPNVEGFMKVVFIPDYKVSLAEKIIPAADISEQISTAGTEASGTSNMKFAINGALTVGTWDGANIEMADEAGKENMFIFGHTTEEIQALINEGYSAVHQYNNVVAVKKVIDSISNGLFAWDQPGLFTEVIDAIFNNNDQYFLFADFSDYLRVHKQVTDLYKKHNEWSQTALINIASMGRFSSDRVVQQYARQIWDIRPCRS